jgi:hypothetical protein
MPAKPDKRPEWKMPEWMEPYRDLFHNTGGNSIEDMMNDHRTTVFENAPRAILCVAVKSQVAFLTDLYKRGALRISSPSSTK